MTTGNRPKNGGGRPGKMSWDVSGARTSYADAVNVSLTRDEVALLFGVSPARKPGREEIVGRVGQCILMNPYSAKRAMRMLRGFITEYEKRYGSLEAGSLSGAGLTWGRDAGEVLPLWEGAGEEALRVAELVRDLKVGFGFERSFKMSERSLLDRRFLMTIVKSNLGEKAGEKVMDVAGKIGMPEEFIPDYEKHLQEANFCHFGFEEGKFSSLYKGYLEFWSDWEEEIGNQPDRQDPFLLYLGYKWDALKPSERALSRYTCHPLRSVDQIHDRVFSICGEQAGWLPGIVNNILQMASERVAAEKLLYMEVTEEGNPRTSFDLNVYKAGIPVRVCAPILMEACRHYRLPEGEFRALLEKIGRKPLGHLSGGIGRDGKDFLTIYYGMEGR